MAEKYEVGNLQIKFTAEDKTSSSFKQITQSLNSLAQVSSKATKAVTDGFSEMSGEIKHEGRQLENVFDGIKQSFQAFSLVTNQDIAQGIGGQILALGETLKKQESELAEFRKAWEQAVQDQDLSKINSMTFAIDIVTRSINNTKNAIAELRGETENAGNSAKKGSSGWKKFIKSIGRIALYRAIRRALQMISGAIKESIQEFAKVDDNVNATMSQITSSLSVIKLSFGATLLPILEAIAPALQQIAIGFANVANVISASMSDGETYWAVNAHAIQDYREQLEKTTESLASFDKIQSLSGKSSFSFLEKRNVEDLNDELGLTRLNLKGISFMLSGIGDLFASVLNLIGKIASSSAVQTIIGAIGWVVGGLAKAAGWLIDILDKSGLLTPILWGIYGVLTYIGATKILTWLGNGSLIKYLGAVISLMKEDLRGTLTMVGQDIIKVMSSTKALAAGIGALAGSVIYLATQWDNLTQQQKVLIPVIGTLIGLIVGVGTALVLSITAIKEALKLNPAAIAKAAITAGLFSAAAGIAIGTAISTSKNAAKSNVQYMADGGSVPVGTLFWAGEAGTETVTVGSSGRTEVTNVSQMETALYNALVRYGRENSGGGVTPIVVQIDGKNVFTATRQEARKQGLDFSRR